jgi:membrane protein
MMDIRSRINDFFVRELWDIDVNSLDKYRSFLVKTLRLLYVAIRDFTEGRLILLAMGLVYPTLLALIPLLAVSFSMLKSFGVHNQLEPFLYNFLIPLGPKGAEITEKIITAVENMKVGVLGFVGLGFLIYTLVLLIHRIEDAFNDIWKIKNPRGFLQKFSNYMSVIIVGPLLIFSALGLTASIMSTTIVQKLSAMEPFGTAIFVAGKVIPYLFVIAAFVFIYIFIPNTRVKFESALIGGVFGGVLWETAGWAFASFVVTSTKYAAVYSGFAIIILFMVWLFMSWLILLVGAKLSFYHQYPQFLAVKKEHILLSNRFRERLSLLIMFLVGYNYLNNKSPWTFDSLVKRLGVPVEAVLDVITVLEKKGLLLETGDDPPGYIPAKDMDTMTLKGIFDSVRVCEDETLSIEERFLSMPEVDRVIRKIDSAIESALNRETLRDLVTSHKEAEA